MGLFARNVHGVDGVVFQNGDIVCPYNGEIIDRNELNRRYKEYTAPYGLQNRIDSFEDTALRRGIGSIINHSPSKAKCRISIGRNNRASIVATKNIKDGEELYINYGKDYKLVEKGVRTSTNNIKYKA